jgi:hypothetical protein
MNRLARFAVAKVVLAEAMRQTIGTSTASAQSEYALVVAVIQALLDANQEAGTIRPGVTANDFVLASIGILQIDVEGHWHGHATRLLDLIMDGLRAGAPGPG